MLYDCSCLETQGTDTDGGNMGVEGDGERWDGVSVRCLVKRRNYWEHSKWTVDFP